MNAIPYGRQAIDENDVNAVIEALKSDFLTQGPKIPEFEKAFSSYVDCDYSIAVSNGTAALHLCAMALGVKKGDKVICPTITFAASANCIRYCGGEVIFCDINPDTYLIDLEQLESILQKEKDIKGLVSVDFAGRAVNLEKVKELSDKYGFWIIQDSCHAPGGYFIDSQGNKQLCGNGKFADLAIFSFHPVKHIACGEGGMVTTGNEKLAEKVRSLRTHGITKEQNRFLNPLIYGNGGHEGEYPGWYHEMQELGYNYRLTEIQAALGISQLTKATAGLERRREIAHKYTEAFQGQDLILGKSGVVEGHAYHLYVIEVPDRDGLYNYLRSKDIYCQVHYYPAHLMPYYRERVTYHLPASETYITRCLSLPMFPTLSDESLQFVIDKILSFG